MKNMRRIIGPALLIAGVAALIGTSAAAQRGRGDEPGSHAPAALSIKATKRFTQKQLDNVAARIELANAIVNRLQGEARAAGREDVWRRSTLESLLPLSLPALEQVHRDGTSIDALATSIRAAAEDPNLIGDPSADLVYTPINPCRYIDTRGGPIVVPATPRGYDLALTGAAYGGSASCSLPQTITAAIAMNVTITEPAGAPAFLAVKPTLAAPTTSFMNWYESGLSVQLANAGVVTVDQSGAANEFFILVSSPTHVIVDFFGFFAEPEATALQNLFVAGPNAAIGAGANVNLPVATCPAGYTVTGGGPDVDSFDIVMIESRQSGNGWACAVRSIGGASTGNCTATCARVPGR